MTLEEHLQIVLGLSAIPDGSSKFAEWYDSEKAYTDFFWYIHNFHNDRTNSYYTSPRAIELRVARRFIKLQMTAALCSTSEYVRTLAQCIARESDEIWMQSASIIWNNYMDLRATNQIAKGQWTTLSANYTKAV